MRAAAMTSRMRLAPRMVGPTAAAAAAALPQRTWRRTAAAASKSSCSICSKRPTTYWPPTPSPSLQASFSSSSSSPTQHHAKYDKIISKKSGKQRPLALLRQCYTDLRFIQTRQAQLPRPSLVGNESESVAITQQRRLLHHSITKLWHSLQHLVATDHITAAHHRRPLSHLTEQILHGLVYCHINGDDSGDNDSDKSSIMATPPRRPLPLALDILSTLQQSWQLDRQQGHLDAVLELSTIARNYNVARQLFTAWMDDGPNLMPYVINIARPTGLYALAQWALQQQHQQDVVMTVLAAAQQLSMASPTEHDRYVLAAGTALGLAGQHETLLVTCAQKSADIGSDFDASALGAACMQACVVGHAPERAWQMFQTLQQSGAAATEWQWAGGQDRLHPSCRNLALVALGQCAYHDDDDENDTNENGGNNRGRNYLSRQALLVLAQARAEHEVISVEALEGVMEACGLDQCWLDAVELMISILNAQPALLWEWLRPIHVVDDDWSNNNSNSDANMDQLYAELERPMLSLLRACNASGEFGVALWMWHVYSARRGSMPASADNDNIVPALAATLVSARHGGNGLLTLEVMRSLQGLHCHHEADDLAVIMENAMRQFAGANNVGEISSPISVPSPQHMGPSIMLWEPWTMAHKHMIRVIELKTGASSWPEWTNMEQNVLATALRCCVEARQPHTGLLLAEWSLLGRVQTGHDLVDVVKSQTNEELVVIDSLAAATMQVLAALGRPTHAIRIFTGRTNGGKQLADSLLCTEQAIGALLNLDKCEEALAVFEHALSFTKSPWLFCIMARGFANAQEWPVIRDLYRLAGSSGAASEELSLLAMKAVVEGNAENRIRVLRNMVAETAALVGSTQAAWLETKYFTLKRVLGFRNARLLMYWNDKDRCHWDELQFALDVMRIRKTRGLLPKNETLYIVIQSALSRVEVPNGVTNVPSVPRSQQDWLKVLELLTEEARSSNLWYRPLFIEQLASAHALHGSPEEGRSILEAAIKRGVLIDAKRVTTTHSPDNVEQKDALRRHILHGHERI